MIRRMLLPVLLSSALLAATWQVRSSDDAADRPPQPPMSPPAASLVTPLISVRRIPLFLQAPEADRRLVADLRDVVSGLPDSSCVAVTEFGRLIYGFNEVSPLIPASTQKLLLGLAALETMGADHVFTTRVVSRIPPLNGVVDGDVWLVGGGDPVLMTDDYVDRFDDEMAFTNMERLADELVGAGVSSIAGAVIGDESLFDSLRYVESWPERFRPGQQNQAGPLSALSVNDGFSWWHATNTANGLNTPAGDPAAFAAALFDDLLEDRDMVIRRSAQAGVAPLDAAVELASIDSPTLAEIVTQMLVTSDNTTAEVLLKNLGSTVSPPGSSAAGTGVVLTALGAAGHDLSGVMAADGSGLDPANRVTCRILTAVLEDAEHGPELVSGLAVAGRSGTMRRRLVGSSAEGRARAKTGTLRDVTSLAGQVETLEGRILSFAVLTNAEPLPDRVKHLHDQVVLKLVAYPSGPDLDLLVPLPVPD
ncbi:MAG TPA: D-alanyl-D-alanine carboxypeptidase/D-alanyl-D-alanine-endopeptidase [Acidimicrobiales bacterium]|nr:D-alanyl-D-alanine carboxypeptidase/D-alanyl-D-alanine-endopeptidase [Acidimicrobiales bacterium]MDP6214393.1 D-alanyl-D-alanine carboxypeptidase/D-alanyl-D-alanine-endopeptidase [Acidimicrobiales bacterium]MDP7209713.1 D-alanyl-D-alanine carboxypeptidase/D-alanyl-D-alanine-endopeptidase [Acidimicrobiales bacterium]HJL90379.1 D-alanyl-D-alanine carboxypeptidase/D-alanyl-D-alanine-endopeptidase [Acidimicrobiales bacterium]